MKKEIISSVFMLVCLSFVRGQDKQLDYLLAKLLKQQEQYLNKSVPHNSKENYVTITNFAKYIRPKVFQEIQKLDSTCKENCFKKFNIIDGFASGYTTLSGLIWKDTVFYTYKYSEKFKLELTPKKFNQLMNYEKELVKNFSDWKSDIFSHKDSFIGGPNDGTYYIASKVQSTPKRIETIAFYYE